MRPLGGRTHLKARLLSSIICPYGEEWITVLLRTVATLDHLSHEPLMTGEAPPFTAVETAALIPGPAGQLQVKFQAGSPQGRLSVARLLVIIAHPHPQHGGTMDNKVVATLVRTYRDLGIATVRFNFRGVGQSEGQYDQARGEVDDLLAVADWAGAQSDFNGLLLAGFSFGSAVAAAAAFQRQCQHLLLVAPPVERYDYDKNSPFAQPVAVVIGDNDELVDVEGVRHWAQSRPGIELALVPDTGHFFHGKLVELKQRVADSLERILLT